VVILCMSLLTTQSRWVARYKIVYVRWVTGTQPIWPCLRATEKGGAAGPKAALEPNS